MYKRQYLEDNGYVTEAFEASVYDRIQYSSTAIGRGVAAVSYTHLILQCIRNAGNNIILGLQIHIKENQILIDQLDVYKRQSQCHAAVQEDLEALDAYLLSSMIRQKSEILEASETVSYTHLYVITICRRQYWMHIHLICRRTDIPSLSLIY